MESRSGAHYPRRRPAFSLKFQKRSRKFTKNPKKSTNSLVIHPETAPSTRILVFWNNFADKTQPNLWKFLGFEILHVHLLKKSHVSFLPSLEELLGPHLHCPWIFNSYFSSQPLKSEIILETLNFSKFASIIYAKCVQNYPKLLIFCFDLGNIWWSYPPKDRGIGTEQGLTRGCFKICQYSSLLLFIICKKIFRIFQKILVQKFFIFSLAGTEK